MHPITRRGMIHQLPYQAFQNRPASGRSETVNKQILVVDNEPLVLDLFIHLLPGFGYYADPARNAGEALEKLEAQEYDAIFIDYPPDDPDGKAFYRKVEEDFPALAKRIVFVTADVANPKTLSFIAESGNRYLEKPFSIRSVKALLESLFEAEVKAGRGDPGCHGGGENRLKRETRQPAQIDEE